MLQNSHPTLFNLGGGWFKVYWLKSPKSPANPSHQQVTAGSFTSRKLSYFQLVTTEEQSCGSGLVDLCASLQPFEHKQLCAQPCRFLRAARPCPPDVAPCGHVSGTTCTLCPFGAEDCSLQYDPDVQMQYDLV
eukprot:541491-Amphidinium_carterae.1